MMLPWTLALVSCVPNLAASPSPTPSRAIIASSTPTPPASPGRSVPTPQLANPASPLPTPAMVAVTVTNAGFAPPSVTISRGTTVVWTNKGPGDQTVTSDKLQTINRYSLQFSSGILTPQTNAVFEYTFHHRGTFHYHDDLSQNLRGTVVVQ
ncbi:MAG: cupredoxin domain-containing protein [Chloroflexota bacterium]